MEQVIHKEDEYPLWRYTVTKILEEFEISGYGLKFSHEQFKLWMGIREPSTIEESKKYNLDYLFGMEKIKNELLDGYNIYLHPVTRYGYQILHPKDQIRKGADFQMRKCTDALIKCGRILTNVDQDELSIEDKNLQNNRINRVAFLKSAFRKRIKIVNIKSDKLIEDKNGV